MIARLRHLSRTASVYLINRGAGPLSFWYEKPEVNPLAFLAQRGYFMAFEGKARYRGPFDDRGVPLLDYRGAIGVQHNPIAIAQYGLARLTQYNRSRADEDLHAAVVQADWLVANLQPNQQGVPVWVHDFDFPYRAGLKAPWYSGLAQGQGVSLLTRVYSETQEERYLDAASRAFVALTLETAAGGVLCHDEAGLWIEEYVVSPPSHILNGFIWALWGVKDYAEVAGSETAGQVYAGCVATLAKSLGRYDVGFWSLYDLPAAGQPRSLASPYYHRLHITQLDVMERLTGQRVFADYARQWHSYSTNPICRSRSFIEKGVFKVLRY